MIPAAGAIQVASDATLVVNFSEALAPAQPLDGLVTLTGPTSGAGTAALTGTNQITFTPATALAQNAT
jgi:hypothetical protein